MPKVGAILLASACDPLFTANILTIVVILLAIISTISFSILVNAWSIGAIDLMGCDTKITEYSIELTIPPNTIIKTTTTNAHTQT